MAAAPTPSKPKDARTGALRLLHAVLIEKRMLTEAQSDLSLDGPEAARAGRLAGLVLRHLSRIDALLRAHLTRAPALRVQGILRLAVAELMLDDAAPHGVVDSAVYMARAVPKTAKQAGLVNAVLRKVAADRAAWDALPPATLPPWLRKPIAKAYGRDRLEAIEAAHLLTAPLDLTLKGGAPENLLDDLPGTDLPTGSRRVEGAQVTALPGYAEGAWWVQDAAAATPVRTLGDVSGLRVLDLCAAPGGKTQQLAAAGADVTALDISEGRARRLRDNLSRTGLAAEVVIADALEWTPEALFDVVVLDAPCSATGTIRRHPDLPHLRKAAEIEGLTQLQYHLLDRALGFTKPGGRLLYCTCSLLPVEGEFQITAALKRHPGLRATPLDPEALGLPATAQSPHGLRLLPDLWADRGGMDGFYIALLTRDG
jgi:16S rRNA (cytosine967-C5)-methyltransferase